MRNSCTCAVWFGLLPACTPSATVPPGAAHGEVEQRASSAPLRADGTMLTSRRQKPAFSASGLFAGVGLRGDPALVEAALAQRWCERGGDSFRPPAAGPVRDVDPYPPRLAGCADVKVTRHRRDDGEGLSATLFTLDAVWEARELLLLQTAQHATLVELERRREDESGEAGTVWREHLGVELRDVTGTPMPEWIARIRTWGGDSYEADHCHAHTHEARELIVCSEREGGFACLRVPYRKSHASEPRPEGQRGDDCGPPAELGLPRATGWALAVDVGREVAAFRVDESVTLDVEESPDVALPLGPSEIALAKLFTDAPLPVDVFE